MQLIIKLLSRNHHIIPTDYKGLHNVINVDICNSEQVFAIFEKTSPDFVIHTAALTDIDKCTLEPDLAYRVNVQGTWNVAAAAARHDVPIVFISTDNVFDGMKNGPYTEYDRPNPLNTYGQSKLAAEYHIRNLTRKYFIIRTSWLFSEKGKNMPLFILDTAMKQHNIHIAADQIASPTYAKDLAEFIADLPDNYLYGTYHFTNKGSCSWYELAKDILSLAGISGVTVTPVASNEYKSPTRKPRASVLRHYNLEMQNKDNIRHYKDALKEFISEWITAKQ
ncbi:MAG: dTDP-4-dehydrorhamnose reductase [Abditibacteriota bacterium]|nr:dTDP-4-dehydrorhamnose reductase [Abditibacteriota bacterium]